MHIEMPSLALALHLLYERKTGLAASFWGPYLSILPLSFSLPLFWTAKVCRLLKGIEKLGLNCMCVRARACVCTCVCVARTCVCLGVLESKEYREMYIFQEEDVQP